MSEKVLKTRKVKKWSVFFEIIFNLQIKHFKKQFLSQKHILSKSNEMVQARSVQQKLLLVTELVCIKAKTFLAYSISLNLHLTSIISNPSETHNEKIHIDLWLGVDRCHCCSWWFQLRQENRQPRSSH